MGRNTFLFAILFTWMIVTTFFINLYGVRIEKLERTIKKLIEKKNENK